MVNYKRVVCEVALLALVLACAAAAPAVDCHYDQRQNGSENYRLNIDGVVIAVAPADSLLAAASELDLSDLLELADYDGSPASPDKPVSEPKPEDAKPQDAKPEDAKPQDAKPQDAKPQNAKPQDAKPLDAKPEKPSDLSVLDVSQNSGKVQRKEAGNRKQEKAQRLKNRLAQFLIPLLRKTRHH